MSSMSTYRSKSKKLDPLSKRIPENPRYKNVRSTLDTGASITRYMNKIEEIRQNYKFKKDEIFKRMKVTTFVQLMVQVYQIDKESADYFDIPATPSTYRQDTDVDPELQRLDSGDTGALGQGTSPVPSLAVTEGDFGASGEPDTARSTLISVAHGVGELDLNRAPEAPPNTFAMNECPYLLLDVRDRDEYEQFHIITAHSYPKAYLSRATNYETQEMLAYKNVQGKIIIVYDEDERIAPAATTTLVQRGYDNIFMLSGGLKIAHKLFPEGLTTGTPPFSLSGVKPKFIQPADAIVFTDEDMDAINIYLDNALKDHSIGTSRLSKASTARSRVGTKMTSRTSTASSQMSSISNRPAFK